MMNRNQIKRARPLLVSLAVMLCATVAPAQTLFSLASQNCLHLGWGNAAYQQSKEAQLETVFANYNVIVLQEVMAHADLSRVTPGGYVFLLSGLQGPGSYKEAYGFLASSTRNLSPSVYYTDVNGFSRPPVGILVEAGGIVTWVVDYHAVYGSSIGVRRAEVSNI
jgi:hypothetical protein